MPVRWVALASTEWEQALAGEDDEDGAEVVPEPEVVPTGGDLNGRDPRWFDTVGGVTTTGTGMFTYHTHTTWPGYPYTPGFLTASDNVTYTWLTTTNDVWASWENVWARIPDARVMQEATMRPPTYHRSPERRAENAQRFEAARAARAEADRQVDERRQRQRDRQVAAEARAKELLLMVLTPAERAHYQETDQVIITGSDGRRYKIGDGVVGNVGILTDTGRVMERWCAHPHEYDPEGRRLPVRDLHVGQILALRHNAPEFIERANLHWRADGVLGVVVGHDVGDQEDDVEEGGLPDGIAV